MKIGYFVETPVEHNLTGGTRSFLNFVEVLQKDGIEPYVVMSDDWALTDELRKRNIKVLVSKMYRPFVGIDLKARFYHLKYYLKLPFNNRAKRRATKWFKDEGVELVHINSQLAGIVGCQVAKKLNLPYVYHIREYLKEQFDVRFYKESQVTRYIKPANSIIAISKAIKDYHEKLYMRKAELVYNGLPINSTTYEENKERFQGDKINLVMVGRVCDSKGQKEAIEAINIIVNNKCIENIHLNIVGYEGTDPYEKEVKELIELYNLSNNVTLHPFTNNPFEITKNCDIGLLCSTDEAFGRVTVEYMLASLLAIGTNSGGTPEIIDDGNTGLLYERGDVKALVEKILWANNNKEEANKIIKAGTERAINNFSIQSTADGIKEIYERVLMSEQGNK